MIPEVSFIYHDLREIRCRLMNDILFMMVIPFIAACLLLVVRNDRARAAIAEVAAAIIILSSVWVAYSHLGEPQTFGFHSETIGTLMFVVEVILGLVIIYLGIKHKKYAASALGLVQLCMSLYFEFALKEGIEVENALYIDDLSIIMVLIIGIIGSLICVYAVGYMRDFQEHHKDEKDRRPWFFFLLYTFLSAMYGIVLSNDLVWMFFFWEITTLCSFALIGYTKTEEAVNNSFRQLIFNLVGGICFLAALMVLASEYGYLDMESLLADDSGEQWLLLVVGLLCVAGMVKAAQMPVHTWLLGAMVAPTPTSALLHSSTMVKAGVFMVLKLSPLMMTDGDPNLVGYMVMSVGGLTFLLASMAAISQSNAKRVLAYSTIANLGLIVACAGVGTPEAVWAGIMLMVFHAITKSMMFLCVGTAEHHIGSRDIEDMDGLFVRMPKLAIMMMIGIAGMFLAPFGMLISKWAAMTSFVDSEYIVLIACIVFGSAVTSFYWTKWLGKLACTASNAENCEETVRKQEWFVLGCLAILTIAVCVLYPVMSSEAIVPYLEGVFDVGSGALVPLLESNNMYIIILMVIVLVLLPLPFFGRTKKKVVPNYMAGVGIDDQSYVGSMGTTVNVSLRNWYMNPWFGESRVGRIGEVVTAVVIVIVILAIIGGVSI